MWVYINSAPGIWSVGFYTPNGMWNPESDWTTPQEAAARVHYLNGSGGNEVSMPKGLR